MKRGDVGMIEFRQRDRLGPEPFDDMGLTSELWAQRLDGHLSLEHQVDALVYGAHAALADLFQDFVVSNYIATHSVHPTVHPPGLDPFTLLPGPVQSSSFSLFFWRP